MTTALKRYINSIEKYISVKDQEAYKELKENSLASEQVQIEIAYNDGMLAVLKENKSLNTLDSKQYYNSKYNDNNN